jgi:hypothetical protein
MSLANVLQKYLLFEVIEKTLGKPFNLVHYLDQIHSEEVIPPPRPDQVYRVSHVIKLCAREEVLRFQNQVSKKQKINAKLRRTFDFGENYHRLIQNEILGPRGILLGDWVCIRCHKEYLNQIYPSHPCEECGRYQGRHQFEYRELTPINTEYGISAHVDGILFVGNQKKILELKTVNAISFKLVSEVHQEAIESHRKQIQLYMWLTGIHQGVILYFDKNESQLFQWEEKMNHSYINSVLSGLKEAREGMRTGVVPKRTVCESITCSRAKSCPVSKRCFLE